MSPTVRSDAATAAYIAWTEHRFFRYRGCAPDPDAPGLAAGGVLRDGVVVRVALDAWLGPDVDGGEEQGVRRARQGLAKAVCAVCPVRAECEAYAVAVPELADGVRAGRTVAERERALAKAAGAGARAGVRVKAAPRRGPVPAAQLATAQKVAVLSALAASADEYVVAMESGLDVRKANWQRARLVSGLGLPRSASRMDLLRAAVKAGLVDGGRVVADDGRVPAIPPETKKLLIEVDGQLLLWPSEAAQVRGSVCRRSSRCSGRPRPFRGRFRSVAGQAVLEEAVTVPAGWAEVADVASLFPQAPVLEVAA